MTDTIRVDLHSHSSMSDGDHSPSYVAHSIAATGALWGALTDHNTVAGQEPFRAALAKRGLNSVTGVEIVSRSPIGPIDLLGYGFDEQNGPLLDALQTIQQPWRASAKNWIGKVRSLRRRTTAYTPSGSEHEDASGPYHPPDTAETICLIHQAGGLVMLAHPLAGLDSVRHLEEVLEWLQPQGLDGLEAYHKQYPLHVQNELARLADKRELLTVAGSDFHGLHHSDGGSPGAEMPLLHWNRFIEALRLWQAETYASLATFDPQS